MLLIATATLLSISLAMSPVNVFYTHNHWKTMLKKYRRECDEKYLPRASCDCLVRAGLSLREELHNVNGHHFRGIKDDVAAKTVVDAFPRCIPGFADGTNLGPSHVRKVVTPTTPLRHLANRLGLKETVREHCASCWGGCHFCCINNGIAGADYCFIVYCSAQGTCG